MTVTSRECTSVPNCGLSSLQEQRGNHDCAGVAIVELLGTGPIVTASVNPAGIGDAFIGGYGGTFGSTSMADFEENAFFFDLTATPFTDRQLLQLTVIDDNGEQVPIITPEDSRQELALVFRFDGALPPPF